MSKTIIDFESSVADDFGGNADFQGNISTLIEDNSGPEGATGKIIKVTKTEGAGIYAGTIISTITDGEFVSSGDTEVSLRVYAPAGKKTVLLKLEDITNKDIFVETAATTSEDGGWQTLTFNFANQIDSLTYNKAVVFFDFGNTGTGDVYYFDDLSFSKAIVEETETSVTLTPTTLDFESSVADDFGGNADFEGNISTLIEDNSGPEGATGKIVKVTKTEGAGIYAGTIISTLTDGEFVSSGDTEVSLRVYAPAGAKTVLLKLEDVTNVDINVEATATTSKDGGWQTLNFNFANQIDSLTYNKAVVFFDFNKPGTGDVYYFDDLSFSKAPIEETETSVSLTPTTLDFESSVADDFGGNADFEGNISTLVEDNSGPEGATGKIVKVTKTEGAGIYAGTIISTLTDGEFVSSGDTEVSLRVHAPAGAKTVLLKLEDFTNGDINVEATATTSEDGGWQTLTFNFANQIDSLTYDKAVVFFDFNKPGTGDVYYFDDLSFSKATVSQNTGQLLVKNWQKTGTSDFLKAQEFVAIEAQDETATHTLLTNNEGILDVSSLSATDTSYHIYSTTNFDGSQAVSVSDVIFALKGAVGIVELTDEETFAADIDNSGDITVSDVISILKMAVGIQPVNKLAIVDLSDSSFSDTVNLSSSSYNLDLHAIVMGDVDASWTVDMM